MRRPLGDPLHNRGQLQVNTPIEGRCRFVVIAKRDERGRMACGGSGTATPARPGWCGTVVLRWDACVQMVEVLHHGRRSVQGNLFCRPG